MKKSNLILYQEHVIYLYLMDGMETILILRNSNQVERLLTIQAIHDLLLVLVEVHLYHLVNLYLMPMRVFQHYMFQHLLLTLRTILINQTLLQVT